MPQSRTCAAWSRGRAILVLPLVSCSLIQSKLPPSIGGTGGGSSGDVIDTSLPDAKTEVALLDGFGAPAPGRRAASAEWLPRQPDGSMRLRPGLWEYAAQSY